MTDTDELLRPEGMRALQAVREEKRQLLATNRKLRQQLHNLRAGVIAATNNLADANNELVDLCENDGAVRNGGSDV